MTDHRLVCYTEFLGRIMRPFYEDAISQYVIDDDGQSVRGVWFIPRDEPDMPAFVEAQELKV